MMHTLGIDHVSSLFCFFVGRIEWEGGSLYVGYVFLRFITCRQMVFCRVCFCGPAVKHLRGSGFMKARIKCVDPSVSENRLD